MSRQPAADFDGRIYTPVTQYMRPHGIPRPMLVPLKPHCHEATVTNGWKLSAEHLQTGEVAVYLEIHEPDPYDPSVNFEDCRVVPNGPGVPEAFEEMIQAAIDRQQRSKQQ